MIEDFEELPEWLQPIAFAIAVVGSSMIAITLIYGFFNYFLFPIFNFLFG